MSPRSATQINRIGRTGMRPFLNFIVALLLVCAGTAFGQDREPLVKIENEIEAARKMMLTERKLVIAGELVLTTEAKRMRSGRCTTNIARSYASSATTKSG